MFYGISSKRYALYEFKNNEIIIKDYKLHGLGHLLNPYKNNIEWQKQIWEDILKLHHGFLFQEEIIEKYSKLYAISKLSVSSPLILKRFKEFNKNKSLSKQIKPFNFILIGQGNFKDVKPISAYSKDSQSVVHKSFINYKTGKILIGMKYWKNLADIIFQYANHPESKFLNGDKQGKLERRSLEDGEVKFIGKETKNIEEQALELEYSNEYSSIQSRVDFILGLSSKEANQKGVSKQTLSKIKKRLRNNPKRFNWKTKSVKKLRGD